LLIDVDTHISPILQQSTNQPAEEIEKFVKLSLFNLAFCRAIGLSSILALDSYIWVAVQLEVVRMVSYADLRDAAPMWWEGVQHLRAAASETCIFPALLPSLLLIFPLFS
jgi:hypothetical protein